MIRPRAALSIAETGQCDPNAGRKSSPFEYEGEESDLQARLIRETEFYCVVLDAIREAINVGTTSKTSLLQQVREVTEAKSRVEAVLTQYTGTAEMDGLWRPERQGAVSCWSNQGRRSACTLMVAFRRVASVKRPPILRCM